MKRVTTQRKRRKLLFSLRKIAANATAALRSSLAELAMQRRVDKLVNVCFHRPKQIRRLVGPDVTATHSQQSWKR